MSKELDEITAWRLVRALAPDALDTGSLLRVESEADPDVWLVVHVDGRLETSVEPSGAARDLLEIFVPIRAAPEIVIGQMGQSLDGRIATASGASHYVTGPDDIERLHRVRALVDAVVVGASTVAHDDPRLTVRLVEGPNPVRVVLDPSGRLSDERRVFAESPGAATLVVRGGGDALSGGAPGSTGTELRVPWSAPGELDLPALLAKLRERGLRRILVEGGGVTVSRFLQAGLLDRLHVTVAPMLLGSGRPSITLEPIESLERALRPTCRHFLLGEDVLFDLDLRAGS